MLKDITSQYKTNTLSKDEYLELCNDLFDTQHIANIVLDMISRQEIYDSYQILSSIVNIIASV